MAEKGEASKRGRTVNFIFARLSFFFSSNVTQWFVNALEVSWKIDFITNN